MTPPVEFGYRPDIDGLRAVAVVLVLLFHCGLGFTGGFVGVDVFFVISGYLITGLILKQTANDSFRLIAFWKRRVLRIIPVASFIVLVTVIAGALLLLPTDFAELSDSVIAQQLMVSNFFFWRSIDYFAGPSELKPLLHTWSLAVEEQFYLFYPFLLVFLTRYSKKTIFVTLMTISILSFGLSEYAVHRHPGGTFYFLPSRAWELLLGGILWGRATSPS